LTADLLLAPADERADIARLVKGASTSFYWAMRLLPRDRRDAIFAVYAFCREVDDIADGPLPVARKKALLADWRIEVEALFAGRPRKPISRVLAEPLSRFGLRQSDLLAVIDGVEMDADGPILAPSRAELDLYCDRVACAVGRLCVAIFGESGEPGQAVARHLGRALQLTNILRDVADDAALGRLYFPREVLETNGIPTGSAETALAHLRFPLAWRELAGDAEAEFAAAREAIERCDRRKMRPARIMMEVYRLNLERMQSLTDPALAEASVSKRLVGKAEKLLIALRYGIA
jgi:phytoene synthase